MSLFLKKGKRSVFCFGNPQNVGLASITDDCNTLTEFSVFSDFFRTKKKGVVIAKRTPGKSIKSTRRLRKLTPLEREHSLQCVSLSLLIIHC